MKYIKKQTGLKIVTKKDKIKKPYYKRVKSFDDMVLDDGFVVVDATAKILEK